MTEQINSLLSVLQMVIYVPLSSIDTLVHVSSLVCDLTKKSTAADHDVILHYLQDPTEDKTKYILIESFIRIIG